jgi:UDP-2-acetamido-2,6-beta-L-arabino-hexul-4-ose reductase
MEGNFGFTSVLLTKLKEHKNNCPIILSSSIQAELDNPYGRSKKAGEDLLISYGKETGAQVSIYRFPNVFGKWSRPNYNSAIATFCHNIARDLPITIHNPNAVVKLVYIDDLVTELVSTLENKRVDHSIFVEVPCVHTARLGDIVDLLQNFAETRRNLAVPDLSNPFVKKLFSTYISFLPEGGFGYDLVMNTDRRGSFTEFLRTQDRGQLSINISKPGITKGNHWHHSKVEKFLVVNGQGVIRFRRVGSEDIFEVPVSGKVMQVVDIPPGYTHNIENTGEQDMVTIMWANEPFNPDQPDTYPMEV